jgi:diacylglycerol kinase (ATP)
MQTCIIFNPRAGSATQIETLHSAIAQRPETQLLETAAAGDAQRLAETALDAGCKRLIAAGGDGTAHEVANAILARKADAVLGILPLGTGNDLSRTLQIPIDLADALRLLDTGVERRISAIKVVAERRICYCINVAAGGFSGQIDEALTDEMKQTWGPLAYLRGAIKVIPDLTHYRTLIRFDGSPREPITALNIIIANCRTAGGGTEVAPMADPQDRVLDVVIVRPGSFTELAAVAARLLAGDYTGSDLVCHRTARRVEIESTPGMWFNVDGELLTNRPITFSIIPDALRVLTHATYTSTNANAITSAT